MKKNIFVIIVLVILSGCFSEKIGNGEELSSGSGSITGSIRYKGGGIIPGTSNFYIEVEAKDPEVARIEVQIKKGETIWNDSGDFGGTIILTNGTETVYLVGKNENGDIIAESTVDISW